VDLYNRLVNQFCMSVDGLFMFHHSQLANGLHVLVEENPQAQSAALGFFVQTGSRDEGPEVAGVSHFLEHMAFKGDEKFTADDINRIFDELGAKYNASTSEEVTCFYAAILPEYLERTFELLSALLRPSLRTEDFELEKQVILEEIGMYQDMPAFHLYEQAMATHFSGHPLGNSILGSAESITSLTAEQMRRYHAARYGAANLALIATGNVRHAEVVRLATQYCGDWQAGDSQRSLPALQLGPHERWIEKVDQHQEHVMQLAPAPPGGSPQRYAAEVVALILGDEQTGRLYWNLVDPGAAESAEISYNDYLGSGTWTVYLCCPPELTAENLSRIQDLCNEFNEHGPTDEELTRAKNKLSSRIVLGNERPMGRLTSLGSNWLVGQQYQAVAEELACIVQLTMADVRQVLADFPIQPNTCVGLGPCTARPV
jgi:predicted Zn-dependent peptidase